MTKRYQRVIRRHKSKNRQCNDQKIPKGNQKTLSLSCLFFYFCFLITLWYLLVIVLSVVWFTFSDYHFGIFWSLSCLFFDLRILITLWYLLVIVLSVLWFTSSDYHFGIFWSLYCLFFDLRFLITLWYLLVIVLSVLWFTSSVYYQRVIRRLKSKNRQDNDQKIPKW
jgi:hypothetical protein